MALDDSDEPGTPRLSGVSGGHVCLPGGAGKGMVVLRQHDII